MKATQEARRHLSEHVVASSEQPLVTIEEVQFIIDDTQAIEDFVVTTIRHHSQRDRRRMASTERSGNPRHRDPSPNETSTRESPTDPRMPPPSGETISGSQRQATDSTPVHIANLSADSPPTRRSSGSQEVREVTDIIRSSHVETAISASTLDASGVSHESPMSRRPRTVGPRIRDNGHGLFESNGEWPSDISETSQISTGSHHVVINSVPPQSQPSERVSILEENRNTGSRIVGQESRRQSQGSDGNDLSVFTNRGCIMEESDHISKPSGNSGFPSAPASSPQQQCEHLDRSETAGRQADTPQTQLSPYKPVPPFNGEKRRRPNIPRNRLDNT